MRAQEALINTSLEAERAFDRAIAQGRLSANPAAVNFAGAYMYMGRNSALNCDAFKHHTTRAYLPACGFAF